MIYDRLDEVPQGRYGVILADPPWSFRGYTQQLSDRDVQRHYKTIGLQAIKALPINDLAAADSHLFLWTTGPSLPFAFDVIRAWGFRYSAVGFTWVKLRRSFNVGQLRLVPTAEADLHVGLGFTTRKNAEFCLLGRRGNARREAKDVREIILSPVRQHSRKPDEARERIERYAAGPYLELFSRTPRPGWDTWGDEARMFKEAS